MGGEAAFPVQAIGVVRSPFNTPDDCPRQGPELGEVSVIEIDPKWAPALDGLSTGQDIWVICFFEPKGPPKLMVHPRGDLSARARGVFSTRSPKRPSPLSLTLVRIIDIAGGRLTVRGLEMVDGTKVLDIKPYSPNVDAPGPEQEDA